MERLTYLLDTNVISDHMNGLQSVSRRMSETVATGSPVYLCQPVYYEVMRGLRKTGARRKLALFRTAIVPLLDWLPLTNADWEQAAQFWAEARNAGYQLSDVDLLVAALAKRLDAVVVSSDSDFDALPIRRENWRQ